MNKAEGALEVSAMVWFDDTEEEWMYYVFIIHDEQDEELRGWGAAPTKAEAAKAVGEEVEAYFHDAV